MKKSICIYGASSEKVGEKYRQAARMTGELIAQNGCTLVFGAGSHGLMGEAARGAYSKGGNIIGVIPEKLNLPGIPFDKCTELIVTPTMHTRKETMEKLSDAFIAMAGGFGTFEELLEIITLKQLRYTDVPVIILNTCGYYDYLIKQFEKGVEEHLINSLFMELVHISDTPDDAISYIMNYTGRSDDMPDKMEEVLKSIKGMNN